MFLYILVFNVLVNRFKALSKQSRCRCYPSCISSIADVAVRKRHQWLNEILHIFTCTSGKSTKLYTRQLCLAFAVKRLLYKACAFLANACWYTLSVHYCMKFCIHDQVFFADFPELVQVKKIKILFGCWCCFLTATYAIYYPFCEHSNLIVYIIYVKCA